jgi:hypothetical protein
MSENIALELIVILTRELPALDPVRDRARIVDLEELEGIEEYLNRLHAPY